MSGFGCKMEEKKCIKIVRTKTLTSIISPNWIESKKEEDMSHFIFVHTATVLDPGCDLPDPDATQSRIRN